MLSLEKPVIMGILNLTPDSFFDGGSYRGEKDILEKVSQMIREGASVIDVGGVSTRPGAELPDVSIEIARVIPAIEIIHQHYPDQIISIDTFRSEVARRAVNAGASMVNDISAGKIDPQLYPTVADLEVPYVLMHMQNKPSNMQDNPTYEDVTLEVSDFFIRELSELDKLGVKDVILDPGFGFGKSLEHNYRLLNELNSFLFLERPILAGLSRKSMIYKPLSTQAAGALNGTTALNMIALERGSTFLRVHDVAAAAEVVRLFELLNALPQSAPSIAG